MSRDSAPALAQSPVGPGPVARIHCARLTRASTLARAAWSIVCLLLFRTSPRPLYAWRRFLLRCFGARIGAGARVYPSTRIWAPWNLEMEPESTLGPDVDCYTVERIVLGCGALVSQYSYLCSASHDYADATMPLVAGAIRIGPRAWVCADVFVGPGVDIGEGAIAGARSTVLADVGPWTIVAGNPAKPIKKREPPEPRPAP